MHRVMLAVVVCWSLAGTVALAEDSAMQKGPIPVNITSLDPHHALPILIADPKGADFIPSPEQQIKEAERYYPQFLSLVDRVPSAETRDGFRKALANREVYLEFIGMRMGGAVGFYVVQIDGKKYPRFAISMPATEEFTLRQMLLIVHHEYKHLMQYREHHYDAGATWTGSDVQLAELYYVELEAYQSECDLAKSQGWEHIFRFCDIYASQGFPALASAAGDMSVSLGSWKGHIPLLAKLINQARGQGKVIWPVTVPQQ